MNICVLVITYVPTGINKASDRQRSVDHVFNNADLYNGMPQNISYGLASDMDRAKLQSFKHFGPLCN